MDNHVAYDEGAMAYNNGESRDANPYRTSSPGYVRWYQGWDEQHQADQMDLIKMEKAHDLRKD